VGYRIRRKHEVLTLFITLGMYAITARSNLIGGETMNDTITRMRLSMRLDIYLRDYTEKNVRNDNLYREEWEIVWQGADAARTNNTLTPELVDDVRVALNKL
jgi:hypothetical protein